jgi:hypothetical protein
LAVPLDGVTTRFAYGSDGMAEMRDKTSGYDKRTPHKSPTRDTRNALLAFWTTVLVPGFSDAFARFYVYTFENPFVG